MTDLDYQNCKTFPIAEEAVKIAAKFFGRKKESATTALVRYWSLPEPLAQWANALRKKSRRGG